MMFYLIATLNNTSFVKYYYALLLPKSIKPYLVYTWKLIEMIYGSLLISRKGFANNISNTFCFVQIINWPLQNIINTKLYGSYAYAHIRVSKKLWHNIAHSPSLNCCRKHSCMNTFIGFLYNNNRGKKGHL